MNRLKKALKKGAVFGGGLVIACSTYAQQTQEPKGDATSPAPKGDAAAPATKADAGTATPRKGEALDTVIITSRMRKEALQTVPISVTTFTEQQIQDAGIQKPADFIGLTPNVSISESQQPGVNFITIRGISEVRNGESPVAIVVDGVLQSVSNQFNAELFDIQQIEVLKGPQGALYGRNAIGGAIVITTKEPSNKLEGKLTVGAGNGGQQKSQISVSGPIIQDKLLASFSGSVKSREGYLENVFLNDKADPYRDSSARLRLIYLPTNNLKVDYRIADDRTSAGALFFKRNNVDASGNYVFYPSVHSQAAVPGSPDDTGPPLNSNIDGRALRKLFDTSLKIDWTTPFGTVTSTSSYDRVSEWDRGDASPYTSAIAGTQSSLFDWHSKSTELRFTSPSEQRLRYIVGAYYLALDRDSNRNNGKDLGSGVVLLGYNPAASNNPSTNNTADANTQTAYAAFGQVNYDITRDVELTGAVRYDRDKRDTLNTSHPKDAGSYSTYTPVGTPGTYRQATFDAMQPKASLRYKIDEGTSVYASYSKGFRSGGFNQDGVRAVALVTDPNTTVTDNYKKEISTTTEVGWKSQFLDRRLTLNGAFFHTNFRDAQYFVFLPAASAQIITNIDRAVMKGFEAELSYRVMPGWNVFANVGYTNATIKQYSALPASVGKTMPYVPKLGYNLGTQYSQPIADDLYVTARIDVHHKGAQYWETLNTAGQRSAFNLYDMRLAFSDSQDKWNLAAWVKNATNKQYNAEFVGGGFIYPGEPRTFGVDFSHRF